MNTHFERIRRYTVYARIIAPIMVFSAFLLYAKFGIWASILPLILSAVTLMIFPTERLNVDDRVSASMIFNTLIHMTATVSFVFWITDMPWFESFIDNIFSRNWLWDWRLIVAVLFWCLSWSCNMVHNALKLKDSEIVSIYESRSSNKPESEQAATRNH